MIPLNIAFFDAKPYDINIYSKNKPDFVDKIQFFKSRLNEHTADLAHGYSVVCAFVNDDISAVVIDKLYRAGVKLIALRSAGFNNVDFKAAAGKIRIVRVPAYSPHAVAEHALALIMSLNRKTHRAYYRTRDNNFNIDGFMGFDMYGKTAGVIGTGKIGKALIVILRGMGMNILAYDKFQDSDFVKKYDVQYTDLESIYSKSDIISLHCPLNEETFHLIDDAAISKMKQGVMIINTGRGKLIDSKALIDGLKDGKIGSAGLDVYEEESEYFFEDFSNSMVSDDVLSRLLSFNNVLITSHQAFFTKEAVDNIAKTTFDNIKDFAEQKTLKNEICYRCNKNSNCLRSDGKNC